MKILTGLIQGFSDWNTHRFSHDNASEAAAMLSLDKNISRDELIRLRATGDETEFSDYVKYHIFNDGHKTEALARKIVEKEIGEFLSTVTCADGKLSASFDGLTMFEDIVFEHKQWNEELAAMVAQDIVPETHMPQVQQQLMISKARKCIFVVSDGTLKKREKTEVLPDTKWFERIRAGWIQFHKDVDNYKPVEVVAEVVGEAVGELPAIVYNIEGTSITTNASVFGLQVKRLVELSRLCEYKTDQDFGDAKNRIKAFKEGEKKAKLVADMIIGEMTDINAARAMLLDYADMMRTQRLYDEKQVEAKSKQIRNDTLFEYQSSFQIHWQDLNKRVDNYMPEIKPDFALAMKGKRTVAGLKSACNDMIASSKIEANATADKIQDNLKSMEEIANGYEFLFNDVGQIIAKDNEDLVNLIKGRIAEHKQTEAKRIGAERERIRKEEEVKAEAKVREEAAEQDRIRTAEQRKEETIVDNKHPERNTDTIDHTPTYAVRSKNAIGIDVHKESLIVTSMSDSPIVSVNSQPNDLMLDVTKWMAAWKIPFEAGLELADIINEHFPESVQKDA